VGKIQVHAANVEGRDLNMPRPAMIFQQLAHVFEV
jgi:hypothetical protein